MGYVTLDALKKTLELTAESYADDDLTLAIDSASETIDAVCGRHFALGEEGEVREFVAQFTRTLPIDDAVEITLVEVNAHSNGFSELVEADWAARPLNAGADGVPYDELKLTPNSSTGPWCVGETLIRVTGKFGWPEVPSPIVQATSLLAARLLKRSREAPFGVAGMGGDGTAVRVAQTDPDVRTLISSFVRPVRLA